jgi:predicted metal-dependent hydrolase
MPALVIENKEIPFELRRSAKARRMHIRVKPGQVEVVAPVKVRRPLIEAFVHENRFWIENKLAELEEKLRDNPPPRSIPLVTGARIPFRGSHACLTVLEKDNHRIPHVAFEGNLQVTVPEGLAAEDKEETVKTVLKDWLLERLRCDVDEISARFSRRLNVSPQRIRFRRQKTRWGSCSAKGSINLNWHLVFVPEPILEYVVVHELCHLRHLNHSPDFWALVESQIPDYKTCIKWLKEYRPGFPSGFWD